MTTPIKQRVNFHSANNTPIGSSRKGKATTMTNHSNTENMTPSRLNRINPPRPQQETVEQSNGDGEGIQVAIRMRPLNAKEHTHKKVWKVLSKYASVAQTTIEGKPLPDKIAGRNFFTYDRTFDESSTTYEVYNAIAQPIVTTACTGRNGTIFAYGQTSSGKTYTMQGSGTIAEGYTSDNIQNGSGGIVHMAAHDIFAYIASCPDRAFVVRASFLEIYNEEVRDLLQDYSNSNKVLQIREDPRRGVFVQSKEMIATDATSLLAVLWQGEKSRSFATTAMNERSSRSHTIFRITIESRSRIDDNDENENEDTGGAIRVSTLNLVDLAGSESVRHTGATGDRQKEGGMINQSLLTLSRVIVALGTPNSSHVNFRDSKLTRILQPSLSGNARMAVVCCATPSELYLEETRSTLLFAGRAKLVKTNAQINEVLDDRSIIRRLQRELALARSQQHPGGIKIADDVVEWERIATSAGRDAKLAKDKLKRLYTTILMNNNLDDTNVNIIMGAGEHGKFDAPCPLQTNVQEVHQPPKKRCRRMSDGNLHQSLISSNFVSTPKLDRTKLHPSTDPPFIKKETALIGALSTSDELFMMRQAVAAKENKAVRAKRQMDHVLKQLQDKDLDLVAANCSNDLLRSDRDEKSALCEKMAVAILELKSELKKSKDEHDALLVKTGDELTLLQTKLKDQLEDRQILEGTLDSLQDSKAALERELKTSIAEKDITISTLQDELETHRQQLNYQTNVVILNLRNELTKSESEKESLTATLEATSQSLCLVSKARDEATTENDVLREESRTITDMLNAKISDLKKVNDDLHAANQRIEQYQVNISKIESEKNELQTSSTVLNDKTIALLTQNEALQEQVVQLTSKIDAIEAQMELSRREESKLLNMLEVSEIKLDGLLIVLEENEKEKKGIHDQLDMFSTVKADLENEVHSQKSIIADLEAKLLRASVQVNETQESINAVNISYNELFQKLQHSNEEISMLNKTNNISVALRIDAEKNMAEMKYIYEKQLVDLQAALNETIAEESKNKQTISNIMMDITNRIDAMTIILYRCERDKDFLFAESAILKDTNMRLLATIESLKEQSAQDKKEFSEHVCRSVDDKARTENLLIENARKIADTETRIEGLVITLQQSHMDLDRALTDRNLMEGEWTSSKDLLQQSNVKMLHLTHEIENLKSEARISIETIQRIARERDAALIHNAELERCDQLIEAREGEIARLRQNVDQLERKCEELEVSHQISKRIAKEILSLFESIVKEKKEYIQSYTCLDKNGHTDSKSLKHPLVSVLQTAYERLGHLSNAFSEMVVTLTRQSDSLSTLSENLQQLEETNREKETSYTRNTTQLEEKNKLLVGKLQQARVEIEDLKKRVDMYTAETMKYQDNLCSIEELKSENDDLKYENKDLKQLLANANHSVEEARISCKEIAKQLSEKALTIEMLQKKIDNKEDEIRNRLEHQNTDQQLANLQKIILENERLEVRLKNEIDSRVQFEVDLRRRMSDEQTKLIQEAEQVMCGLREELEHKTNALKSSEAEAYSAREMKDDLEDQYRRTLDRAIQLESKISALENESNRLRRVSHRQKIDYESEVARLNEQLTSASCEKQENRSIINKLQQAVNSLQRQLDEVGQELSVAREQLKIASSNNFEQENKQLSNELRRLNRDFEELEETATKYAVLNDKVKEYEYDNDKLRQKLKAYVERCEKLESSKLTKDKLEAIKKLMADKAAVEKQLKTSQQEIERLKSLNTTHASSQMEDTAVTTLRFDKEALESKFKKIASQCQHLEDEKQRIIYTFKSAKIELNDDNIEKAIVTLCDKVASLEEECDCLAKYKNKVFSNEVELNTLHHHNAELSSKVTELQRKIDNLRWVETGHKNLISSMTKNSTKLQHDVDNARQEASSVRNQLKYLEQENLQLMMDYKAAKQKIHVLKAELNHLHSQQMSIAPTASTSNVNRGSTREHLKTPSEKENVKGPTNHNSENKKNPPSSNRKSVQTTNKGDRHKPIADRLDAAFAGSDENTQECKQS